MTPTTVVMGGLLVFSLGLPAQLEAQGRKDDSTFRWQGAIASGKTLEVKGVNGSVVATGTSGREARVRATKRARKSDVSSVEIRVVEDGDGITICAVYLNNNPGSGCDSGSHRGKNGHWEENDVNVDFVVEVPAGVKFDGSTVNGDVEASGITADAEVTSVNGDVVLATSGVGSATTVNGSVRLRLGKSSWTGEIEAKTVNGKVIVEMPTPTDLEVTASTLNGDFESDFPITIQGKASKRNIRGVIGKGGPELNLQTVNGEIVLRKAS